MADRFLHLTHWGAFEASSDGKTLGTITPYRRDPEPYKLLDNIGSAHRHPTRIQQPYIRAGWLDRSGQSAQRRGRDEFVPVDWNTAIAILGGELERVYREHGASAVYGGSYGWASAGRFHHAQSQLHRFLNCLGGYVRSVNNYSYGTSQVLLPHVLGVAEDIMVSSTSWSSIARNSKLVVAFGGMAAKNAAVASGGVSRHDMVSWMTRASDNDARFVLVSPIRDDMPAAAHSEWMPIVPGTDAALMLGLAHTLITESLVDAAYVGKYTTGYDVFERYVLGSDDGIAKSAEWASKISEVPASDIQQLARDMAARRTLITVSWSLQRARNGEQPVWLAVTLAAMIGQIGLPGGGFGNGYSSAAYIGHPRARWTMPSLPQGNNPVKEFIPVARVSDMLLHPGEYFDYDGRTLRYPDVRLVYWCGGNPFHHHQDLRRLTKAFQTPDTIVVHDPFWTSTARHADIVLPSTMSIERDDFGAGKNDDTIFAMHRIVEPYCDARDDYDIFSALAHRLGVGDAFSEGRDAMAWIEHLYESWRCGPVAADGGELPPFAEFWADQSVHVPLRTEEQVAFADFYRDPDAFALKTPSGRIEISSKAIESFGYEDCPGHPAWISPEEWLGSPRAEQYPLHMIANQPYARLHSQLDVGEYSQATKISGREPIRMREDDAASRGLVAGDIVRVFNDRGSCLAGVVITDTLRPRVVQLSTGAWYDPDIDGNCVHGNPNVLTPDIPTSRLSQGCSGQHVLVEVEKYKGTLPPITVLQPPPIRRTVSDSAC